MKLWDIFSSARCLLLASVIGMPFAAFATEDGLPFTVIGEQLIHPPPTGWKLAWMSGNANGSYVVEYIPEAEDINLWRGGYLAIERLAYPPAAVLKKIDEAKARLADVALFQFIKRAKETCGGQHSEMSQRTNVYNGVYMAVGGGFCDRYGPAAPFGEGSFLAFAEGKEYLFRIQYGWRPNSLEEKSSNIPWRITRQRAEQYLEAIMASSLCGGLAQPTCRTTP